MADNPDIEIPKKARDLFDKGLSAMERNNLVYAMDMFMAAMEVAPHFLQARKLMRVASVKQFNQSGGGSITHITSLIGGLFSLIAGQVALKTGKHMKALEIGEQLLRKDPLSIPFIRFACKAAESADMPESAIHTLSLAREHYPDNVEIISWLGKLYTASDKMDEARECFEKVVELRPNDAAAMRNLKDAMARDTMSKGGWHEVAREGGTYRDVIRDVRAADVHEQADKTVKAEKGVDLLIEESENKLKATPENMAERRKLAKLYYGASRFDEAIKVLEDGHRITGTHDPAIDQLLNEIRLKQFDYEIARHAKEGDPAGAAALEAKKKEFLNKDIESRVKRYPNDLSLRYEYGVMLYANERINEAIQQFQMSERNPSLRVKSLYHIALCFMAKQQFDMARAQLERAAAGLEEMDALKKEIYYQLGQVLESMGDPETAVDQYYKAIYQADIGYKDVASKIENAYKHRQKPE